jgi:phospholipid/cholesterol/gamma-HCH transport system substrate-binding protein
MIGPSRGVISRIGNRAYGVAFLLSLVVVVGLAIATFQKKFTPVVMVTLMAERIGNQLQDNSDVKIRGLIVGEVRSITSTGNGASIVMALQPDQVAGIPLNVSARILPKTLFGERYVDLVIPSAPSSQTIAEGDTISQDRTKVAIELERVFDDLLPLLRTVKPEKLAATLNALATALDGRGTQLGHDLVLADKYLAAINPKMPTIQADISRLADLASTYSDAAPDVLRMLKALTTTNATIVEKQNALAGFLAGTAGFANTATTFLNGNGDRIIQVGRVQRPTLALAARYAPEYPCFASGLADWIPRATQMFSNHTFHITLEAAKPRAPYRPGEEPAWGEHRGPSCMGLPNPGFTQAHPRPGMKFADGTNGFGDQSPGSPPSAFPGNLSGGMPGSLSVAGSALPSYFLSSSARAIPAADSGMAGSADEQQVIARLFAQADNNASPSAIITLLTGPILRGMAVSQS